MLKILVPVLLLCAMPVLADDIVEISASNLGMTSSQCGPSQNSTCTVFLTTDFQYDSTLNSITSFFVPTTITGNLGPFTLGPTIFTEPTPGQAGNTSTFIYWTNGSNDNFGIDFTYSGAELLLPDISYAAAFIQCSQTPDYCNGETSTPPVRFGYTPFPAYYRFRERAADSIMAQELEQHLSQTAEENEWAPATVNRYRALVSLVSGWQSKAAR